MFNSVRTKLTLWYSVVLALVLIVFAFAFYFLIEQTVKQLADDALEDATDSLITRFKNNPDLNDKSISEVLEDFRFQYIAFTVYDKNKNLIAQVRDWKKMSN